MIYLIVELTKREIISRYRGSMLGMFWAILTPMAMLAVFTTIVGALIGLVNTAYNAYFKDRQTAETESKATEKAVALAEVANTSP